MNTQNALKFLEREIHTVIIATADDKGLPVTCAVDIMDSDEQGLYFLTAKGKGFYDRLKKSGYVSLTGIKGGDTLSCTAVSVRGKVCELGNGRIEDLIRKNPYMEEIYSTEQSRRALTVFRLYEGSGEWFDLSKKPVERASFVIGNAMEITREFKITEKCTGCGICGTVCPQSCIDFTGVPAVIKQNNCLRCGNCFEVCPQKAVTRKG
ncbi:MAG: 4Fe-4S binding protein [Clostridiales bacterium]|nr:4Fe-4S binding protein [Clostridiales bacterium]